MKKVRTMALTVLMAGILLIQGRSGPRAFGQQPARPDQLAMPGVGGALGVSPANRKIGPQSADSTQLAKKYAQASKEEDKKEIKKQLADSLNKEFDQLVQAQQAELDDLEKQVASLKAALKKREESKENIVERRLEQLILDAQGLGWGSPKHPGTSYTVPFAPGGLPTRP